MNKLVFILALLFSATLFAAEGDAGKAGDDAKSAEEKCRQWAQEDGVAPEEMEKYMADCVKDISGEGSN